MRSWEEFESGAVDPAMVLGRRDPLTAGRSTDEIARAWEESHHSEMGGATTLSRDAISGFVEEWKSQVGSPGRSPLERSERLTGDGAAIGTLRYMPPEQLFSVERLRIGAPSDLYALGAVLYEMLTGRPPFADKTLDQLLRLGRERRLVPSPIEPPGAVDLEAICMKCLSYRVDDRYPTSAELVEDLDRFLDGRSTHAGKRYSRPPSKTIAASRTENDTGSKSTAPKGDAQRSTLSELTRSWWPFGRSRRNRS